MSRGIVDGRIVPIRSIVNGNDDRSPATPETVDTQVALAIPYYQTLVQLDPSFSVLIEHTDDESDASNRTCTTKSKKSLAWIGILVGCLIAVVAISIGSVLLWKKKMRVKRENKKIENRLKNIQQ
eukprot:gene9177-10768_t